MNKTAIKNYAIWARNTLIEAVRQRAFQYGITEKDCGDPMADSVNGFVLTTAEKKQRQALIAKIREKGYKQVCEEVAYTWFNRFIALRFMEVNGYLPTRVRVFTDEENTFKPQILSEATHLELDGLKQDRVIALKEANKTEELFKYLLITQCNALSAVLPGMFQKIEDYTELLLPDNLLREGSVIEQLVTTIPEEDWTDQVQIIGWLYQYYNTELKDKVFADLKKNIKISKEKIPAATQLFTPDWIVRYMVENSLGRLWVEGQLGNRQEAAGSSEEARQTEEKRLAESMGWKYYLPEAPQEPEVRAKLNTIAYCLSPTAYRVIDPCCGSGHILCYLFDVLMQIYEASGYTARDAAQSILLYNLWGLDIDERAAQLSYFAVMMKARQHDRRFFTRNIQPHVYAIADSNSVSREAVEYFCKGDAALTKAMQTIITELHDAKEYGSILTCSKQDWDTLYARFKEIYDDIALHREEALSLLPLVQTAEALSQQYDVVVTNPPYMGSSGMSGKLSEYVKKNYPGSKNDLFAVFIERGFTLSKPEGYMSMITMESWMFLSSFEKLRLNVSNGKTIVTLVHMPYLGKGGTSLGINFGTDMVVIKNRHIPSYNGTYDRIAYYETDEDGVPFEFPTKNEYFKYTSQDNFSKIPGSPVAYWVGDKMMELLSQKELMGGKYKIGSGLSTADNERFLRMFWEVENPKIARESSDGVKWYLFQKGGDYRKWYGNLQYVVNWENDGEEIKYWVTHNPKDPNTTSWSRRIFNTDLYFLKGITWGVITSGKNSFRICNADSMISNAAGGIFGYTTEEERYSLLGALNSKVWETLLQIINPTINTSAGILQKSAMPILTNPSVAEKCVQLSKADWDSFETSWDFKRHPLV